MAHVQFQAQELKQTLNTKLQDQSSTIAFPLVYGFFTQNHNQRLNPGTEPFLKGYTAQAFPEERQS